MSIVPSSSAIESGGYLLTRSLRFRSAVGANVAKSNPVSPADTSLYIKTYSVWVKRGSLGAYQSLLSNVYDANNYWGLIFTTSDTLQLYSVSGGTLQSALITTQVFLVCNDCHNSNIHWAIFTKFI